MILILYAKMETHYYNREFERKAPYEILRFELSRSLGLEGRLAESHKAEPVVDFVEELKNNQKKNLGTSVQACVAPMLNGQFIIVDGDHGIWALDHQKGNHVELTLREKDEPTRNYLRMNTQLEL
jgi:hypothetical protein